MSGIDLHIHSCYSDDGELSVGEIIKRCEIDGIVVAAITDHNCVRGVREAQDSSNNVRVLSGVELDCTHRGKGFHLLGYGFDHTRAEFLNIERNILSQERAAGEKKIKLFCKFSGIDIDVKEVLKAAPGGVVTGELIAEILLRREDAEKLELLSPYLPGGEKSDMPNVRFYWDFFSPGKPAYVPINYISLSGAVRLLHSAGGIAVLAHPGQNLGGDYTLLADIIAEGIDGLEAFSSYHTEEAAAGFYDIAKKSGLLVTCGSDFHGKNKPNIQLGGHGAELLYDELTAKLKKRLPQLSL